MKTKYTPIILFSLFSFSTFSQGEYVVEIDRTNGSFTKTGPAIAGITWIYPDDRTFDENTGTFFFPSSQINHCLYSIDVSNGSIISNPIIGNISSFQFDNASNILYGLEQDNANNVKNFISINPVTGTYSQIGNSLPNSSMFSGGYSTFNKINHTYIFLDFPNILYSINATNGNIILNPNLILASGESIVNFAFDNSANILYGLLQDYNNGNPIYFLVTIDPITGTNTRIGSGTNFGIGGGSSAVDEINQQYIYLYHNGIGGFEITTLDISTGNVIYHSLINPISGSDNVYSLKYDNNQGKLYSIHWEDCNNSILSYFGPDLLAYYPFNNGSLIDLSINSLTLTNSTGIPQPAADREGYPSCAYQFFGGSADYLNVDPGSTLLGSLSAFSISLWYAPQSIDIGNYELLFGRDFGYRCPDGMGQFSLGLYDCKKPVFSINNYSCWDNSLNYIGDCYLIKDQYIANGWQHLAAVYDPSLPLTDQYQIYRDGILSADESGPCGTMYNNAGDLLIGLGFTGFIDDISFFKKALSPAEINQLINMGSSCCDYPVNINAIDLPDNTLIYPNPVSDELNIETIGNKEKINFEIYNILGQIVFKGNLLGKTTVQTSGFAPGIYLIILENEKKFEFKKIIKE
jgi:hypothetical protein